MRENTVYESIGELDLPEDRDAGVLKDETVDILYRDGKVKRPLRQRRIAYWDAERSRLLVFLTNNFDLEASAIAAIYRYRWQIELLFKKLKQNFPLKYFLGDSRNAIEIQIWCALISLLLTEVIRKQLKRRWAFSNMVAMVRFHMMSYVHLVNFLNDPEKELRKRLRDEGQLSIFQT